MTVLPTSQAPPPIQADSRPRVSRVVQSRATAAERWVAAGIAVVCASILGVAVWLSPSPNGVGTHRALGLPECGWISQMNMPCPSCGMTTAFSHAAHGSLLRSFAVQPMGALLALATASVFVVAIFVACTGSMVGHVLADRMSARILLLLGILAVMAWGYKILLHRGLLPFDALGS
ncbi:MAG: DUF2752 domain-containing protein [Phycisphaerae bacterium]|nr:DUF2752 domain-containing protein [Phycisphaerae bacterium]